MFNAKTQIQIQIWQQSKQYESIFLIQTNSNIHTLYAKKTTMASEKGRMNDGKRKHTTMTNNKITKYKIIFAQLPT